MHGFIVVDLFSIGIVNYNRLFNPLNLSGHHWLSLGHCILDLITLRLKSSVKLGNLLKIKPR